MASAISIEYLLSIEGQANGLATLDANGTVPTDQLPTIAINNFKGEFATAAALQTAYPTAKVADYAYVTATKSFWYWNIELDTAAWVNQEITTTAYNKLTDEQKAGLSYIITA